MERLNKLLHSIDNFMDGAGKIFSFLCLGVLIVTIYETFVRYALNSPTYWAHETTQFFYGAYAILSGGYVLLHKAHVNMDIVYSCFSTRVKAIIDLFTWILFFLFIGLMLWKGWTMFWNSVMLNEHSSTFWGPIVWPFKLTLPVGAFLILLTGLTRYIRTFITAITGRETS